MVITTNSQEVQSQPQLHSKFEAKLGYVRPGFKKDREKNRYTQPSFPSYLFLEVTSPCHDEHNDIANSHG